MASRVLTSWEPRKLLIPSSLLSVCFHAVLIAGLAFFMPEWKREPVGFGTEPSRQVGIVVEEPGEFADNTGQVNGLAEPPTPQETVNAVSPIAEAVTPTPTNFAMQLPTADPVATIGPGEIVPPPSTQNSGTGELVRPSGESPNSQGVAGGIPGVPFFGLKDNGTKIVFVIDSSGSMDSHNSMLRAKAELISSLQALQPNQQFQVIFYNSTPEILRLRREEKPVLYPATDVNRTLAKQVVAGIQPSSGTQHMPALKMALRLEPEVIFLLTDADEPVLNAADRDEIRRFNRNKARIHCVEFGVGDELKEDSLNFLKKLARENGGTYRYVDVAKPLNR